LTDDYRIIQETQAKYPDWKIYTLCTEDERGYHHQEFMKEPVPIIRKKLIRLFASIEILRNSQLFIGTFSSNPGMFLGMLMEPDTCIDVEGRDWLIW
jgi:hypothetical protein